jgi:hypothetical protein
VIANRERAELFAQYAIQVLTGYQVGNCPIVVRPCITRCIPADGWLPNSPWMTPYISNGRWYNSCGCGPKDCSCTSLTTIRLGGPVGEVIEVLLNGVALTPGVDYRVDNHSELVYLGGEAWPACQDMAAPVTADGTMAVTYVRGVPLDSMGETVAGILAKEYLNACADTECRLPSSVVSLARQGVNMQFGNSVFPNNKTGIDAVDLWVQFWNPYNVRTPSRVYSVDVPVQRQTSWSV